MRVQMSSTAFMLETLPTSVAIVNHSNRGPGNQSQGAAAAAAAGVDGTTAGRRHGGASLGDSNAVAGYNLYRRLATEDGYTRLNTAPITGLPHTDTGLAAAGGATYYYVLTAVDSSSDESVKSAPAAVTISAAQSSSSGGGGGCFIASVGWDLLPDPLKPLTALALLICLGWRRGGGAALCALRSMSPAATFEERGCAT